MPNFNNTIYFELITQTLLFYQHTSLIKFWNYLKSLAWIVGINKIINIKLIKQYFVGYTSVSKWYKISKVDKK